eukprot:2943513-Rhodomonas_salina.1
MLECFNGLDNVHLNIMRCIALGLDLDPGGGACVHVRTILRCEHGVLNRGCVRVCEQGFLQGFLRTRGFEPEYFTPLCNEKPPEGVFELGVGACLLTRGFEAEYFTPLCNENHQNLWLLKYPSCKRDLVKEAGQKRAGTHTDYGTITLVLQEKIGGLQACRS